MKYQWIVLLGVDGTLMDCLRTAGRLLTRDWFPQSFIVIGYLGLALYGVWLEYSFCKKGQE